MLSALVRTIRTSPLQLRHTPNFVFLQLSFSPFDTPESYGSFQSFSKRQILIKFHLRLLRASRSIKVNQLPRLFKQRVPRMKALILLRESEDQTPRVELRTVTKPELKPNHVLIKVYASAIHPSDVANSKGLFEQTTYPRIAGRDFAGVIEDGPSHLIGMAVCGTSGSSRAFVEDGFQAEYSLVHEDCFVPKPSNLSFIQAATLGVPFTTALMAIHRTAVKPSDTVLVIGATGAVGSCVVQLVRRIGAQVLTASRQDVSDVNTEKDPSLESLNKNTRNGCVEVVIDTVGSPELMHVALSKLADGGRLAFIAAMGTKATLTIDMKPFYHADLALHGCNSLNLSAEGSTRLLLPLREHFESGTLKPSDNWETIPLDQGVEAYERLRSGAKGKKYVITMV